MLIASRDSGLKSLFPLTELWVALALLVTDGAAILLTRAPRAHGGIALLWPGNAVAAALLIRLPRVRWLSVAALILLAIYLANAFTTQRPLHIALLFTLINGSEIALMVFAFRFVRNYPYPDITVEQAAIMTAVFGVTLPGLCALAGGALQTLYGVEFAPGALTWWSSDALGACLFGPPLILASRAGLARLFRRGTREQTLLAALLSICIPYLAIRYVRFPFVLIELPLLIAAFRFGGFGTSLLSLCSALTIIVLWALDVRPFGLERHGDVASLAGVPTLALLLTVMPPIAVGLGTNARRSLTRALQERERHFRTVLEDSPIGILVADLNGIWEYTNHALQRMLGYTAEEFRAMPPGGPSAETDWQASKDRWGRLLTGEVESYDVERRFQHKSGKWIWTHVAVSLLRDADGAPSRLIAQMQSLEERRRAEERLAEEREKLKITLHSIADAVITTDASVCITYINSAAEALLGLRLDAVTNRPIGDVLHLRDPSSSKAAVNLVSKAMVTGQPIRRGGPCELHRPDGFVRYVEDTVSPVFDSTSQVVGIVIVFRDATEAFAREQELRRSALHDTLTGLYTRAEFQRRLRAIFEKATQLNRPAALIAIDLDRFKQLNDTAGHAGGDACLRAVAETLRKAVRTTDTVARLGGDEFIIILDQCTLEHALVLGRKIAATLNPLQLDWDGARHEIGASLGIAMCSQEHESERGWLIAADKACYAAKAAGRGGVQVAPV